MSALCHIQTSNKQNPGALTGVFFIREPRGHAAAALRFRRHRPRRPSTREDQTGKASADERDEAWSVWLGSKAVLSPLAFPDSGHGLEDTHQIAMAIRIAGCDRLLVIDGDFRLNGHQGRPGAERSASSSEPLLGVKIPPTHQRLTVEFVSGFFQNRFPI